jgi:hypothetical protein
MPTNYTKKRRMGAILTDANTAINFFTQRGVFYFTWATVSALNVNTVNGGTAAITATATTPNGIATEALLNACTTGAANSIIVLVSPLTSADQAPSRTATPLATLGEESGGGIPGCVPVKVWTDTSRQFRFRFNLSGAGDTFQAATVGWMDPLRN